MPTSLFITTTAPSSGHRLAASVTALALLAAAVLVLPFGRLQLAAHPGFMPAFGGMMFLCDMLAATLLFSQARAMQDRSSAALATAYLFSACVIVPHLLAFPGVFADRPVIGSSASAVWLWCVWHAGFALCVARYAWRQDKLRLVQGPVRVLPILAGVVAAVVVLSILATAGLPFLPDVLQGGDFRALNRLGIGPAVALCNLGALALVAFRLRGRTVIDVWLTVAMLAASLDAVLTLTGGGRYTVDWYAARLLSLATGITILVALFGELASVFRRLTGLNEQLQQLSLTDGLTQITNRRGFDEALQRAWRDAVREETAISLLMLDIDHFKGLNDSYGHPVGDECLRRIAALLSSHQRRPYDLAARVGGEEFTLLMPVTEEDGARVVAERVRIAVESLAIPNAASPLGHVTVSGGVATLRPSLPNPGPQMLTEAADHALYAAKTAGRNRIAAFQGVGGASYMAAAGIVGQDDGSAVPS